MYRSSHQGMRHSLRAALALACLSSLPGAAAADGAAAGAAAASPRIGLALSGGGARGIAHVGVLKVLEEMRVPIHCVTGTSMGSIVGGTYAAGTPPARLQELVLTADWAKIFRDQPPRVEIAIRQKTNDYKTLFAPEFGVKDGGLALPKGVIAGVSIEAFFRVLAEPAIGTSDFRRLPIPFAAMATDIETGESIVLDHGSVAQAMRASMSVPGALAPVEIDGRLLVDGGIADNLPIAQARKLCADVVIAVNISTPPMKRKDLTSALSVAGQLVNFLGKQTVDDQLKSMGSRDVLIEPDLGDISSASFERSKDAIRIGEEATRALAASLARYSLPPEQYAALRARQVVERVAREPVDEVRFEGLTRVNPAALRGLMETVPGEPVDEHRIGTDLRRIYGTGDFESIDYRIVGDTGPRAMVITPREKSWGPDYLRFGLGLESDFQGGNAFNVLVQYRRTALNSLGAEWLTEVQVGQDTHLYSEFFQPVSAGGRWFVMPYGTVGQVTRGVFEGNNQVADYLVGLAQGGFDAGALVGTKGILRVGPVWTQINARVDTGPPVLGSLRELTAGARVLFRLDQMDHAWFPQSGYTARLSGYQAFTALGSALDYRHVEGQVDYAHSWGEHTLNVFGSGGTALGTDMPAYDWYALGGPLRLSGFRTGQFTGRDFAFGRAMYYKRVYALPDLLGSGIYAGASAEVGRMGNGIAGQPSPGTMYSASLFLGADTFAGPAYLGVGYGISTVVGNRVGAYLLLGAP